MWARSGCRMREAELELGALSLLQEVGYELRYGTDLDDTGERSAPNETILSGRLEAAVRKLNPQLDGEAVAAVVRTVCNPPASAGTGLIEKNRWLHTLLTDGVEVEYRDAESKERRGGRARLIDFDDPSKNDLLAVQQLTITGETSGGNVIRPDLVLFVNGLPLVVIELKDPTNEEADLRTAYRRPDGRIGYRCPAEPIDQWIAKGGSPDEAVERKCLCNSLVSAVGLPQLRDGGEEPPLLTAGDDLRDLDSFLNGRQEYTAADVIAHLVGPTGGTNRTDSGIAP